MQKSWEGWHHFVDHSVILMSRLDVPLAEKVGLLKVTAGKGKDQAQKLSCSRE